VPSDHGLLAELPTLLAGFQLVPVVGAIIAELLTEGRTGHPIAPLALARLALGSSISRKILAQKIFHLIP
jgi:hypothetical protein